jgi:hypothetical protein
MTELPPVAIMGEVLFSVPVTSQFPPPRSLMVAVTGAGHNNKRKARNAVPKIKDFLHFIFSPS